MSRFNSKIKGHLNHTVLLLSNTTFSNFGVKYIFKRDIVGLNVWFSDSREICEYLDMRKGPRMNHSVIDQAAVDKKRMKKTARKIDGCMVKHLFDYNLITLQFMQQSSSVIVMTV